MTKFLLSGANGKMGNVIRGIVSERDDCEIVAGVDINTLSTDFPVYSNIKDVKEMADVIVDFSNPAALQSLIDYSKENGTPLVIATTGYSEEQKNAIKEASQYSPIFFTYNMSIGINLLVNLAKKAVSVLGDDFDVEIVEKHHNQKIDAPSGTALMLADAIAEEKENKVNYEFNRHSKREKRPKDEIGLHSIRGGTIVGEHDVMFCGKDEIITLSHSARSKEIFAVGAIKAALYMNGKPAGMYDMSNIVE